MRRVIKLGVMLVTLLLSTQPVSALTLSLTHSPTNPKEGDYVTVYAEAKPDDQFYDASAYLFYTTDHWETENQIDMSRRGRRGNYPNVIYLFKARIGPFEEGLVEYRVQVYTKSATERKSHIMSFHVEGIEEYAPVKHTHSISEIIGLQEKLEELENLIYTIICDLLPKGLLQAFGGSEYCQ